MGIWFISSLYFSTFLRNLFAWFCLRTSIALHVQSPFRANGFTVNERERDKNIRAYVCVYIYMYIYIRTDAFKLWSWRRLLRVLWTARRSSQSILNEINPEYSLEWLILKLTLQYFGHFIQRVNSLEKTLMLGKIE